MNTLLKTACFMVIATSFAFSEESGRGSEDHDDSKPLQIGYAVVTPAAAPASTGSGLVIFETFGLRRGMETTQAGLLPPDLTTRAILFVNSSGRLSKNMGVAIVNPDSSSTTVTMTLRNELGTQLAASTIVVAAHQQVSKFITELFTGTPSATKDFTGTLTITSTSPVSLVGLRFRGSNFSTIPVTTLSATTGPLPTIATNVGGPGAVLLPQFAANGGWSTEIVVVNTSSSSVTVRVDLFKADGTPLPAALNGQTASSFTNLSIAAGGVLTLSPRNSQGDDDF